eukprot:119812_1
MSEISWSAAIFGYVDATNLLICGRIRDFFSRLFGFMKTVKPGYAPLRAHTEAFYTRRFYGRVEDVFNRPISSCPASKMTVMVRDKKLRYTGEHRECINLGSYNYLGFAEPHSSFRKDVLDSIETFGISSCSPRTCLGSTTIHRKLEIVVARFTRKPAAMVFGMGFGTNSTGIPAIVGVGDLVISDSKNHASIIAGCKASGAKVRIFRHNDMEKLESVIRESICVGQPRKRRKWRRIIIAVEGIYSMEGDTCNLKEIVELKKLYKCFLYIDEAHSIGAIGKTGRGICDYAGVSPEDVDILMGTFTKSFGSVGGYIAGPPELIHWLRTRCAGSIYSPSISPACCAQIIGAMRVISGEDGTDEGARRLKSLHDNSVYFREFLDKLGCHVIGEKGAPVIPVLLSNMSKTVAFARESFDRNLAVVIVGFPATTLLGSRVRFCVSSAHTRAMLEECAVQLREVIMRTRVRFRTHLFG